MPRRGSERSASVAERANRRKLHTYMAAARGVLGVMLRRLLLSLSVCAATAWACSVPVFRYALEHWEADAFEAVVTRGAELSEVEQSALKSLEESSANLRVRTVVSADAREPRVSVRFPREGAELWSGSLAEAKEVLHSPAREEIVKRLGEGESAVWVLLESGDRAKDAAAFETIEKRLEYLAGTLELPKLEAQDIANGLVSVAQEDLRLAFSTLRVRRDDAAERLFVRMLLATERDLAPVREPIVFPVFGRGRALYALVGDGIKRETIDRAATFLIGKCSCEVKEKNPGADLLLAADWDAAVKVKSAPPPDLPTLAEIAKAAPVAVTITGDVQPRASKPGGLTKTDYAAAAAGVLLIAAVWWARRRR